MVSSRTSGARVEARSFRPPTDLADVVERFWLGAWDLRGQPAHTTERIADPTVHLVFEDGAARLVGVWTRLWRRTLVGRGQVRAAKLHPGAARALLAGSAHLFSNRIVPLADAIPDSVGLPAIVLGPVEPAMGLSRLAGWIRDHWRPDPQIGAAMQLVQRACDGTHTRVDSLAAEAGMSSRALQRLFKSHVGASPKWVMRWSRLQEVAARIDAGAAPDLAALAYSLGYADQAHLARDFRAATGRTLSTLKATL